MTLRLVLDIQNGRNSHAECNRRNILILSKDEPEKRLVLSGSRFESDLSANLTLVDV